MKKYSIIILILIAFIILILMYELKQNYFHAEEKNILNEINNSNIVIINSSKIEDNSDKLVIDELKQSETERDISKVKMTIKDEVIKSNGLEIIIEDKNETPYVYDSWFEIKKLENGQWNKLKYSDSYISYDMGYMIYEMRDGKLEEKIDWTKEYEVLDKGKYKLIKRCMDEDDSYKYLEAQFEIK